MNDKIYLKDIAGYEEEKDEARKLIEILKNYEKYSEMGAYVPRGLILSGHPGVGKTMLAKAIANESQVPLFEFESNEYEEDTETIKKLKELFASAKKNVPSIIFIDELDELVMTADFASNFARKTTKILLTEIDGLSSSDGVLVIATTNNRAMLPPALIRSGRMDKRITFDMPDSIDREAILKLYLGKNNRLANIDATILAAKTTHFTGADIKTLVNETIIDCAARKIDNITIEDFERNIPTILFKEIKKNNRNGPSDAVCYHEIGHFITEYKTSGKISSISTERYGNIKGYTMHEDMDDSIDISLKSVKQVLTVLLGGLAAEEILYGDITNGAIDDVTKARVLIKNLMSVGAFGFDKLPCVIRGMRSDLVQLSEKREEAIENKEKELLDEAFENAKKIIKDNEPIARTIYKELKDKEILSVREIKKILGE